MPHAMIDGNRMWYEVKGSGPHVLQIGGAGFAHLNFLRVSDEIAKHFTVIETDQLGNGYSDKPDRKYTIESWTDEVAELLDSIGVERTHVHSSSTGGMIAIRLASKYPEKVDRLILGATAAKFDFMCKWVRLDKVDGSYLPEVSGLYPVWNWRPGRLDSGR